MKSRTGKILLHILASLCFLAVPVIFSPDFDFTLSLIEIGPFRRDLLSYVLLLGVFYANYYYFIPKFFHQRKFLVFGIITVLCFAVIVALPSFVTGKPPKQRNDGPPHMQLPSAGTPDLPTRPQVQPGFRGTEPPRDHPPLMRGIERNFLRFSIVLSVALLLQMSARLRRTERDKLDAELSYLKAQINPHFLFNTLNSIYSLAITRSEHTPGAVQKLSEMMRYVTTEAHNDTVLLQKEIDYVRNYVELQRIRLGQTVKVDFKVTGEPGQKRIAPLVMIPFVENAFKYGVNPEEESEIVITIAIEGNKLSLFIKNKIVKIDYSDELKSGHGIDNVVQRLKLGYAGKHNLNFGKFDKDYLVNLEMEL